MKRGFSGIVFGSFVNGNKKQNRASKTGRSPKTNWRNNTMKARKGGFTLVELLIVIMIIAILAGMMLLATGSATDNAEATKVINDLRNLKSAALLYYGDNNTWPTGSQATVLNRYSDRPIVKANASDTVGRYVVTIGGEYTDDGGNYRVNLGVTLEAAAKETGVQKKLASKAASTGLLSSEKNATAPYSTGTVVWMNMR
jgi:general secretion pathway protein G